tara:strand:+ start:462 stop:953 length:492 start_codon:yes stop_codon:yes gene_type:complete
MFSNAQTLESAYPLKEDPVPLSKRGYHTNNKYDNVPPLMNDGRSLISTNQSNSVENSKLLQDNNIKSNWQYRKYLTQNAKKIIDSNYLASTDNGFINVPLDIPSIGSNHATFVTNTPYKFKSIIDKNAEEPEPTDLKKTYLTREQLQSRKISPAITQEELLNK